jgi:phage baseplate assembly protein gpV
MRAGGPRRGSSDMALCGIYYGVVTGNKDEELNLARVKVKLPWLADGDQTHWARLAVTMVGDKYGTYFLPEVGDSVYVVFIGGDIEHPVVIGGQWNKTDEPPEVNENGKNDFRFIKSRSGHRALFDDSDKAKVVLTDTKNENVAGVGMFAGGGAGPNKYDVPKPPPMVGSPAEGVSISCMKGKLTIACPDGKLTVKANDIEITSKEKSEMKLGGEAKIAGGTMGDVHTAQAIKAEGSKTKVN